MSSDNKAENQNVDGSKKAKSWDWADHMSHMDMLSDVLLARMKVILELRAVIAQGDLPSHLLGDCYGAASRELEETMYLYIFAHEDFEEYRHREEAASVTDNNGPLSPAEVSAKA